MSRPILTLNQSGYVNLDDPAAPSTPQNLSPSLPSGQFGARTPPGSPYLAGAFASSSNSLLPPPSPRTPQEFAEGVARGEIGADYGRYAPSPHSSPRTSPRGSPAPSIRGRGWERNPFDDGASFRSGSPGRVAAFAAHVERPRLSEESSGPQPDRSTFTPMFGSTAPYSAKEQALDDALHTYSPADKLVGGGGWRAFSLRGWLNFLALVAIAGGLVAVFAGYPIADWAIKRSSSGYNAFSLGGAVMNGTGQVPVIPNLPGLIDADTPEEAMTKIGNDGHQYQLVFSDEVRLVLLLVSTPARRACSRACKADSLRRIHSSTSTAELSGLATTRTGRPSTCTTSVRVHRSPASTATDPARSSHSRATVANGGPRVVRPRRRDDQGRQPRHHARRDADQRDELPLGHAAVMEQVLLHRRYHRGQHLAARPKQRQRLLAWRVDHGQPRKGEQCPSPPLPHVLGLHSSSANALTQAGYGATTDGTWP